MKTPQRATTLAVLAALTLAASACRTAPGDPTSHWNVDAVPARVTKAMTGYRGKLDGSYKDYQWRKKKEINLTIRRHLLNNNPTNPFEVEDPTFYDPRPPIGFLPSPFAFFGVDSIAWGLIIYGWSGTFVPVPVDALIAVYEDGGWGEFRKSFVDTFAGSDPTVPPKTKKFKVKHR